ncbi:hypothetical protein G6F65_020890 [Rhizopus arrhizus]|nr:hypothetical protein G6F65_020890 [Rhizopus arrhizus]
MHVVARLCDGFHQGSVGGGAIHQPGHFGGAARCQPGGGLGDLGQLGAVGIGWADVAVVLHARTRTATAQALPLHLLRAEQVVDEEAQVRQQRQRQDPAQRGHRLALLQHDPASQREQVQQVGHRQDGAEVGDAVEPVAQGVEEGEHPPIIAARAARDKKRRPGFQGRLQSRHDCCVAV